jgi:hypothetical protein
MGTQRKEAAYAVCIRRVLDPGACTVLARGVLTLIVGGLVCGDHPRWIPYAPEPLDETF